jgi:uncharacterized protein (DUF2141 family)
MKKYLLYLPVLFLGACANIVTPSGGKKDILPPIPLKASPPSHSINFNKKSIKIDFNEFVKITDAANQIVVSPFMKKAPELKLRGKSVIVDFTDTLKPNTTYTVSFGNAISDITENNVLSNYRYVFSTGNGIDSLMLKGSVKNAFTLKPESDLLVMLYNHTEDSVPCKETPLYISKTNESGNYSITNVRSGKYKIFALRDMNSNYLFDQPNEKIAFIDSLVLPKPVDTAKVDTTKKDSTLKKRSDTPIDLYLFEEIPSTQRLLKTYPAQYGKLVFIFRKPVQNISFIPQMRYSKNITACWNIQEINSTKDTVILWIKNPDIDSLTLQISDNNIILDTAKITLLKKDAAKNRRGKDNSNRNIQLKINASGHSAFDFYKPLTIESSTPLVLVEFNKIVLKENKDTVKPTFFFTDSIKRIIHMEYKWKEGTAYSLFIPPGTLRDIFGLSNDTTKIDFKTSALKDYGNIKMKLKSGTINCKLILQLVTENDVTVQEKYSTANETVKLDNVLPGNYKIKVICDVNSNKKWDTGNYFKKILPEKIYYYPSAIQIRANWDLDLDWEIAK